MALNSTVYKADLQISNMDTHYYNQHKLTVPKHPSETDERVMVRIAAFAMYAQKGLCLGKGVSEDLVPALWVKNHQGDFDLWIEVGLPDERRIRKASGISKQIVILAYGGRGAELWWQQNRKAFLDRPNVTVYMLPADATQALAKLAGKTMQFSCMIEGGELSMNSEAGSVVLAPTRLR